MGLRDAIAATAGTAPPPTTGRRTLGGRPTCTNCQTENHNRCPSAITQHGRSGWSSDFDCECYHREPEMHASLVEADDEEWEGHFGRSDWDTEGRQAWDSVGGQFPDDW